MDHVEQQTARPMLKELRSLEVILYVQQEVRAHLVQRLVVQEVQQRHGLVWVQEEDQIQEPAQLQELQMVDVDQLLHQVQALLLQVIGIRCGRILVHQIHLVAQKSVLQELILGTKL